MKTIYSIFLLIALAFGGTIKADELVVADDTWQKDKLPINSYDCDATQHNQFIYPASELQAMKGATISGIKFHTVNASYSWSSKGSPTFTFKFAEVEATTLSGFISDASFTQVYQGKAVFASNAWDITFDDSYSYNGGNLLIDVASPAAGYISTVKFYSAEYANAGWANGTGHSFLPKATFTYEPSVSGPGLKVLDGTTKISSGYEYNFGLATAGTTKTFTLSNPGTETTPVAVAHTGSFGVELSAESIPAGGEVTLTVSMPDATGSDVITLSSTVESIEDFVINVSGTVRDASKVFEPLLGGALPEDWTSTGYWYWSTTDGAYNSTYYESGNYRLITPQLTVAEGEQFFVEVQGRYNGYQGFKLEYSADGTTWTASATVPTITSEWQTLSFDDVPAGKYYIALHGWQVNVRNFYGGSVPSVPKDLVAAATTVNSVTLSWTAAGSETAWKLQYSTDGENWSEEVAAATNPFELTGLNANTFYYVRVRADIADSEWSKVATFRTDCGAISALPWSENFNDVDAGTLPACWDVDKANGTGQATIDVYAGGSYSLSLDSKALRFNGKNTQDSACAILPPFEAALNTLQIQFSHKAESASSSGKIELGYMKDGKFYLLKAYDQSTTMKEEDAFALTAAEGGDYIAFRYMSNSSWEYANVIDDITVSLIPNCPNPTELKVSEVSDESATVAWVSDADNFALQLKSGEGEWTDVNALITDTFFVLTNLDEQTTYQVRVKAVCGEDLESEWVESVEFTTSCAAKTLGYEETFSAELDACWDNSKYQGNRWVPATNDNQDYFLRYQSNNDVFGYAELLSPAIELPNESEPVLFFYWMNTGVEGVTLKIWDGETESVLSEDLDAELNEVTGDSDDRNWQIKKANLSAFKGKTVAFKLHADGNTKTKYASLDNFKVCQKPYSILVPTDLTAVVTENDVNVTWTAAWDEPAWELQFGPKDADIKKQITDLTEPAYTFEDLENGEYEVQVRAAFDAEFSAWSDVVTFEVNHQTTAISNTAAKTAATKRIVNGQLIIERNGEQFNAQGVNLK